MQNFNNCWMWGTFLAGRIYKNRIVVELVQDTDRQIQIQKISLCENM